MNTEEMKDLVEDKLKEFLPERWTKEDIKFYLNNIKYDIDVGAINDNLSSPSRDFVLRGGKRIRPVLFLACIELFGGDPKNYLDYAVLIELVHNGTLVLDDIEDDGLLRRGKPTIHKKFGLDTATNVGMSLHVLPLKILSNAQSKLTPHQTARIWKIYTEEMINVSFGQSLDIHWHKNPPNQLNTNKYLEMVRLKTGSLMRMSMRMACALTNRSKETEELFKNFAESLGMGFQIIDDCLDLDSENGKFGKTFGNDITEGKYSLPVVLTLNKAANEDKEKLFQILNKHTRDKTLIKQAIDIVNKYDSIEISRQIAKSLIDNAWNELEKKWEYRSNMENLHKLSYFFVTRDH